MNGSIVAFSLWKCDDDVESDGWEKRHSSGSPTDLPNESTYSDGDPSYSSGGSQIDGNTIRSQLSP